jgi:hypothetical protein
MMQSSWASQLNPLLNKKIIYRESLVEDKIPFPTTAVFGDATKLELPAGDWSVTALLFAMSNGATVSRVYFGIGTSLGNNADGLIEGINTIDGAIPVAATRGGGGSIPDYRVYISQPKTYYLKIMSTYTGGIPSYACRLSAIRLENF